jgi:hypothetical protein
MVVLSRSRRPVVRAWCGLVAAAIVVVHGWSALCGRVPLDADAFPRRAAMVVVAALA